MPVGLHIQDEQFERNHKSIVLIVTVACFFGVLFLRLFFLQIIQGQLNIRLSQENAMQLKVIKAPRGLIYDRNGVVLVRNRPSYSIAVLPYKLKSRQDIIRKLCSIREENGDRLFDSTDLVQRMRQAFGRRFDQTRLKEDISMSVVSIIEEHAMELPGISVENESRREYTMGPEAFHALGYMSEIPEDQFDSLKKHGYQYGDLMGKAGIEHRYEDIFRGKDGQEYIEVNAYGKSLGRIKNMPRVAPLAGDDVYLTLDADLQHVAYQAFPDSLKGGVVVMDPRSGEVLVMLSSPSVDPNIFSLSVSLRSKNWATVALDPNLPLNNRAIAGTYPPGSCFKLVSAIAGLSIGKLQENSHMPSSCNGVYHYGRRIAHCWKAGGHGSLDLVSAIQQSCNVYFYQVGLRVGDEPLHTYAQRLGLGPVTGIDIPGEKPGWLSGEKEYNERFAARGWRWTNGLVLDMAIGQTELVTPIQLADMIGAIGNTKYLYRPFLLKEVRNRDGIVVTASKPTVRTEINLSAETIRVMQKAMAKVIEIGGTGGQATVPGVPVGGKTGSAQNPQGELTHALFIAIAPIQNPVIACGVVVENAGHGGSIAAPIAGKIFRYYFANKPEGKQVVAMLAAQKEAEKASSGGKKP
ncbi:MAG: penicillin-binding protein 2 [Chitinivibrionales bacterium]|nr:penicillin-binding protein 2 [Chitinivibrionales bacterium]